MARLNIWSGEHPYPMGSEIQKRRPWIDLGAATATTACVPSTTHGGGGRPHPHEVYVSDQLLTRDGDVSPSSGSHGACGMVGLPNLEPPDDDGLGDAHRRFHWESWALNDVGTARLRAKLRWVLGLDGPVPQGSRRGQIWAVDLWPWPDLSPTETTLCVDVKCDAPQGSNEPWYHNTYVVVPLVAPISPAALGVHQVAIRDGDTNGDDLGGLVADCGALLAVSEERIREARANKLSDSALRRIDTTLEETFRLRRPTIGDKFRA